MTSSNDDAQLRPGWGRGDDAGQLVECGRHIRARPVHPEDGVLEGAEEHVGWPLLEKPSLEEQPHAMAARCFVHVGGREYYGHPLGQEVAQKIPEFAAAHRIDAVR